jgi:hypothetical protein
MLDIRKPHTVTVLCLNCHAKADAISRVKAVGDSTATGRKI